jgi:hypothetical protein
MECLHRVLRGCLGDVYRVFRGVGGLELGGGYLEWKLLEATVTVIRQDSTSRDTGDTSGLCRAENMK